MGFSGWKIWWHPRLTRKVMEELEQTASQVESLQSEIEQLRSELAEERGANAQARFEYDALVSSNESLAQRNAELSDSVERITAELLRVRHELDERKSTEEQLREFHEKMDKAVEMKQHYEQRIHRLRAKIIELKRDAEGAHQLESDLLGPIDMMAAPPQTASNPKSEERKAAELPDDSDWIESLEL